MANYTIGVGGDFLTLEEAATDPTANTAGNTWKILNNLNPLTNVAAIDIGVLITGTFIVDCSQIGAGFCITGGDWSRIIIKRLNNTAATLMSGSVVNNCTIDTPLQENALVGCTGDKNAVKSPIGTIAGLTGSDNIFVAFAGVTGAFTANRLGIYSNGASDYGEFINGGFGTQNGNFVVCTIYTRYSPTGGEFLFSENNAIDEYGVNNYLTGDWGLGNGNSSIFGWGGTPTVANNYAFVENTSIIARDGINTTLNINGDESASTGSPGGSFGSGTVKRLFARGAGSFFFEGVVTEFWYRDPDNSSNDIQLDFTTFGSANINDISGNGDHCVLNGATWVLTDDYTPLNGGSLKLSNGGYAGAVAPGVASSNKKSTYSYEY